MKVAEINENVWLPVKTENIIRMPLGLLGFEKIKQYVLLSNSNEAPFSWLRMLDDTELAFIVICPFEVFPEYQPDVPDEDMAFLGITKPEDVLLYSIVTLRRQGRATVNLKGPIVVNRHTLVAKQVILSNSADFSLEHSLPTAE
jgi:flagellar assembly factor FliW